MKLNENKKLVEDVKKIIKQRASAMIHEPGTTDLKKFCKVFGSRPFAS